MVDMTTEQVREIISELNRQFAPLYSDNAIAVVNVGLLRRAINALASQPAPVAEPAQPAAAVPVQALSDDLILQWALAAPTNRVTGYVAHRAYAHGLAQPRAAEPVENCCKCSGMAVALREAEAKGRREALLEVIPRYVSGVVNNNQRGHDVILRPRDGETIPVATMMIACPHPDLSHDCCIWCGMNMAKVACQTFRKCENNDGSWCADCGVSEWDHFSQSIESARAAQAD